MTLAAGRRERIVALALLAAAYLLLLPYAATHLDLARDVYVALRAVRGEDLPLSGPLLAGTLHLGPLWYYALAMPVALGANWFGIVVFIAVIGALQFPLAYLAGKALHSRAAGIVWSWLLLLPSWSTFEALLPQHTQWTATFLLAAVVAAARFERGGRARYFFAFAMAWTCAIHAHPTTAGLAWIGLGILVLGVHRRRLGFGALLAAGLAVALPFLPMLIDQLPRGMPLLDAAGAFFQGETRNTSLGAVPALVAQSVIGGLQYWYGTVYGGSGWTLTVVVLFFTAMLAGGAVGYVAALRDPQFRRRGVVVLLAGIAIVLVAAMLRTNFPYYMTTVVRVVVLGFPAIGLAYILGPRTRAALAVVVVGAQLALVAMAGSLQTRGAWPIAAYPLFDVRREAQPHRPLLMMPAYAMQRSADFLCSAPSGLHGPYALHALHGHALEARLACGSADVQIGGMAEKPRAQWVGLPRHLLRGAGLLAPLQIGPVGLLPVRRVLGAPVGIASPDAPRYPPVPLTTAAPVLRRIEAKLSAGERLAITHLAFPFAPDPVVEVRVDGRLVQPVVRDAVTAVWSCQDCDAADLRIEVLASDFDHLDIVTF